MTMTMADLLATSHQFVPKATLHAGEAYKVPTEDLSGWCIVYRVWDRIGGLGGRYGAPGKTLPLTPAQRDAAYLDDYEDEMASHAYNSQDPDWDYTQDWVCDL